MVGQGSGLQCWRSEHPDHFPSLRTSHQERFRDQSPVLPLLPLDPVRCVPGELGPSIGIIANRQSIPDVSQR
jgi:hypothetical protein